MKVRSISLIALCLCLLSPAVHAQITKGNFLLGGSLGFSSGHTSSLYDYSSTPYKVKQSSVSLSPNVSYFVIDHLSLGVVTPLLHTSYKPEGNEKKTTYTTYSIGPLIRYYFPLGSHWAIFPEASYSYGWAVTKGSSYSSGGYVPKTYHGDTRNLQGGLGLVYFLNHNIGVEGKFRYQALRNTYERDDLLLDHIDNDSFDFTIGLQVYLLRNTQ